MFDEKPTLTVRFSNKGSYHGVELTDELNNFPQVIAALLPVLRTAGFPWLVAKNDEKGRIYFDVKEVEPLIEPYVASEPVPDPVVEAEKKLYERDFKPGDKVVYLGDDTDFEGYDIFGEKGTVIDTHGGRVLVRFSEKVNGHGPGGTELFVKSDDLELI